MYEYGEIIMLLFLSTFWRIGTNLLLLSCQSLLYEIVSSLRSASTEAASSSSVLSTISNTKSVSKLLSEVAPVTNVVGCLYLLLMHFSFKKFVMFNSLINCNAWVLDRPPLYLIFVHLCLEEISMGVYRKVHRVVKYLKLKWMNLSIEHRELMLTWIKSRIEALLREHV